MSRIIGRVVVGVDGSPGSLQALRHAVNEARARQTVLVPVLAWTPPGGELGNRRYQVASLTALWRQTAERKLLAAFDEALGGIPMDLDVQAQVVRGPAGRVLVLVADRSNDLLVVGAGRRGLLRHALHASIARQCLAKAGCAVIAVPPNPLARQLGRTRPGNWPQLALLDSTKVVEQCSRPGGRPGAEIP